MRKLTSLLIFSATLLFVATSSSAKTTWKINKYRIVQQAPDETRNSAEEEAGRQKNRDFTGTVPGLTTVQMRALEKYFVEIGKEYQRLGFKEPKIDTLTKTGDAFEIFVFDYDDTYKKGSPTGPARYGPICASVFFLPNGDRYLRIDSSRILKGSKIASKAYEDVAHEMFHAIQQSYPLFENNFNSGCKLGHWIIEGTAEAMGIDMALSLKNVKIYNWGPREYAKTLRVTPQIDNAYWTASLWRYIGEYVSNGKNFPPVKQNNRPDYRYLQKFFAKEIDAPNEKSELDWLDDNLTTNLGVKLANIYPNFISTFAHYVPDRTGGTKVKKYHERLFEGCERVTLTENITSFDTAGRKFGKVSARCIEVFYEGPENKIDIGIYLAADQKTVGSIQHIGVQYHDAVGKKNIKVLKSVSGSLPSGKSFGDWTFENIPFVRHNRSRVRSNIFIITNITDKASDTHANPIVSFRVSYAESVGNVTVTQSGP